MPQFGYNEGAGENIYAMRNLGDTFSQGALAMAALRNRQAQFMMQQQLERQYLDLARQREAMGMRTGQAEIEERKQRAIGLRLGNEAEVAQQARSAQAGELGYNMALFPGGNQGPPTEQQQQQANLRRLAFQSIFSSPQVSERYMESQQPILGQGQVMLDLGQGGRQIAAGLPPRQTPNYGEAATDRMMLNDALRSLLAKREPAQQIDPAQQALASAIVNRFYPGLIPTNAPSAAPLQGPVGKTVRVKGPGGQTGTMPANSTLPPGWTIIQ